MLNNFVTEVIDWLKAIINSIFSSHFSIKSWKNNNIQNVVFEKKAVVQPQSTLIVSKMMATWNSFNEMSPGTNQQISLQLQRSNDFLSSISKYRAIFDRNGIIFLLLRPDYLLFHKFFQTLHLNNFALGCFLSIINKLQ